MAPNKQNQNKAMLAQPQQPNEGRVNLLEIPDYLAQVIEIFVAAIPQDAAAKFLLDDKTEFPTNADVVRKQRFLATFVRQQLDRIARYEYASWVNGQMPFVSPREIQLWRLRQFAEFVWDWNLPDDDDLANIFNLTKRQATNLVADFHARFRKIYLYPMILRRLIDLLAGKPVYDEVREGNALGKVFRVSSKRYVHEMKAIITELRGRVERKILRDAITYKNDDELMWVADEVLNLITSAELKKELLALHPVGGKTQ